jgi:UDP-N-acetylmuramoyl-L-alanyl-D-glutamate--2,6-diaminopimelate ligase
MSVSFATGVRSGVSLREIFPDATFFGASDVVVRSCTGAARKCQQDDLFVALLQAEYDGHDDATTAVSRGAEAVLAERLLPVDVPQCIVKDSRVAYGQLCQALAGYPCGQLKTVAVAGTDGKTTTAHLIASILQAAGKSAGLHSSIQSWDGRPVAGNAATIRPPILAGMLAGMVEASHEFSVVEADSVSLAGHRFAGLNLDGAVLTNVRGSHFGVHNNLANYRRAQLRTLEYLKPQGTAVLNIDDPGIRFQLEHINCPLLAYGIRQAADVQGRVLESDAGGTRFTITAGDTTAVVQTHIPGQHHVYNCLAAATTALLQGISMPEIVRGLEAVTSLPGRMKPVRCGQTFNLTVDAASSPYRLGVALHTLKRHTRGRLFCVFNTPGDADARLAGQFGRIAERGCHVPVITRARATGNSAIAPRHDYEPVHQILDGFNRPARARVIPDRIAAIEWALSQARSGDSVLIAGQGEKSIASLSNGRWQLTDTEVCQAWLYGQRSPGTRAVAGRDSLPRILPLSQYRPC